MILTLPALGLYFNLTYGTCLFYFVLVIHVIYELLVIHGYLFPQLDWKPYSTYVLLIFIFWGGAPQPQMPTNSTTAQQMCAQWI